MKTLKYYIVFVGIVSCMLFHSVWGLQGLDKIEGKWVKIVKGGKALDSWGHDTDRVGKYTPHPKEHEDYDRQLWMIKSAGDGFYTIFSKDTKKNLDSWDKDSERVGKYDPHSKEHKDYDHQLWTIRSVCGLYQDPAHIIISKYTNKALDYGKNDDQVKKTVLYQQNNQYFDHDRWRINGSYKPGQDVSEIQYISQLWEIWEPEWTEKPDDGVYY